MKKGNTINISIGANKNAKDREQVVLTPPNLYRKLNKKYHFDFDPCPVNPKFNGLEIAWGQSNYVNPPYNNIKEWLKKAIQEQQKGKQSVFLIPANRSATKWFHEYILKKQAEIIYMQGRVKFLGYKKAAPFPTMLVIYRGKSPVNTANSKKRKRMNYNDVFADYEKSRKQIFIENGQVKFVKEKEIQNKSEKTKSSGTISHSKQETTTDTNNSSSSGKVLDENRFKKYYEEDVAYLKRIEEEEAKKAKPIEKEKLAVKVGGIPHKKVTSVEEKEFREALKQKLQELKDSEYQKWQIQNNDKKKTPLNESMRKTKQKEELKVEYFEEDGQLKKKTTLKIKKPKKKSKMEMNHPEENQKLILKPKTMQMNGEGEDPTEYVPLDEEEVEPDVTPSSAEEEEEISVNKKNIQKKPRVV